jgi:hypothetical protein
LERHDRTLAQIFQDKEEQDMFLNRFLWSKGTKSQEMAKDIAETLAVGTPFPVAHEKEWNVFLEKKSC